MARNSSMMGIFPPPPGVEVDFNAPPTLALNAFLIGTIFELVIPTLGFFLRLYVRLKVMKQWSKVDWCFLITWCIFVTALAIGFTFPGYGIGRHAWDIPADQIIQFLKFNNIQQAIYDLGILFSKATILLQLQEVFVPTNPLKSWRGRFIILILVINSIFYLIQFFLKIFECVPRERIWDKKVAGTCVDINKEFVSTAAVNVVEDFVILLLPLYWVYQLKLSVRKRLAICCVFALGFVACICSVFRLAESVRTLGDPDLTVSRVSVALFAQAELSAALLIPVLPVLPRFVKHVLGRDTTSRQQSYSAGQPSTSRRYRTRSAHALDEADDLSLSNLRQSEETMRLGSQITNSNLPTDDAWKRRQYIVKTTSVDQESHRISDSENTT